MPTAIGPNVGRNDAIVRIVAALAILAGAGYLLRHVRIDWVVSILTGAFVLVAYLLMTAIGRYDLGYVMLDHDTLGGREARATRRATRRGRQA